MDASPTPQWRPTATARTSPDQPVRALPTRAAPLCLTRPAVLPNTDATTPAVPLAALSRPPGSHTHSGPGFPLKSSSDCPATWHPAPVVSDACHFSTSATPIEASAQNTWTPPAHVACSHSSAPHPDTTRVNAETPFVLVPATRRRAEH